MTASLSRFARTTEAQWVSADSVLRMECHRRPRPDESPDDEWRAGSDGLGEVHVFCPECWTREFSDDAPGGDLTRGGHVR